MQRLLNKTKKEKEEEEEERTKRLGKKTKIASHQNISYFILYCIVIYQSIYIVSKYIVS